MYPEMIDLAETEKGQPNDPTNTNNRAKKFRVFRRDIIKLSFVSMVRIHGDDQHGGGKTGRAKAWSLPGRAAFHVRRDTLRQGS
jgi:hypothetical protein